MTGYSEQSLFFVRVPDLRKLCSVFLSFHSSSYAADAGELRNNQVKTCRQLLHLYSDIIACPVLGAYGGITVVMAITFFKKGVIQIYAQSHSLQIGLPQQVLPSMFQTCLSYSLTARLAPNWNKVGQYLIEGRDFLSDVGKRIAVVLELSVNETEVCVSVEACTVRLPPATFKDFDVPALVMEKFLSSRDAVLHTRMPNNWCFVLPSMKKGQVISISRTLPVECPFNLYAELQNHWNSMYGYQLPPLTQDEVVYCSVYFKPIGEKLFTYPLSCIRIQPVQCFPRVNLQGALETFLSDVATLLENVCGFTARMTSKPCYHTTKLSTPSLQESGTPSANLTRKSSSRLVLTQLPSVCPSERLPLSQLLPFPCALSQPVGLNYFRQTDTVRGHGNNQNPSTTLSLSQCHGPETQQCRLSLPSLTSSSPLSAVLPSHSNTHPAPPVPKLVPIFKNKLLTRDVNVTQILAEKKLQKQAEAQRPHFLISSPSSSSGPSTFPSIVSRPSAPRVSLPYFKNRKGKPSVCTTPVQPLSQIQPAAMTRIPNKRGGEMFQVHPKKPKVNIQDVDVVKLARSNQLEQGPVPASVCHCTQSQLRKDMD
ncbi:uncharacterized protein C18orf63-like isoform X2 [Trichomycterus rosablanca]|uniref:uncharacterized protein C18orf63-like isoform X2 n=1 Tax=Trichomycterus rosablanca TaxID=2290929 RepID=UPI002F35BEC1